MKNYIKKQNLLGLLLVFASIAINSTSNASQKPEPLPELWLSRDPEKDLKLFIEQNGTCINCNLKGLDLRDIVNELTDKGYTIDLHGSNLENVNFYSTNMPKSNLIDTYLKNTNFKFANLTNSNLNTAKCYHTNFNYAKLQKASFNAAHLDHSKFKMANLEEAWFIDTYVFVTNFKKANMQSIVAAGAKFGFSDLTDADCHKAQLNNAELHEIDIRGTNFSNADLSYAKLYPAYHKHYGNTLQYATLFQAYLKGTKFKKADINRDILHNTINVDTIEIIDKE